MLMTTFEIPDDLIEHVSFSGVVVQRMIQAGSAAALTEAAATIERQKSAMAAMEQVNAQQSVKLKEALETARAYDVLVTDTQILMDENRRFSAEIDRLKKLVGEPPKPPVIVPPVPPVVPVTPPVKDDVFPLVMAYFEDPRPSDNVDDQKEAKEHADAIVPVMAFAAEHNPAMEDFITFCNPEDVKWNSLPRTMLDLKKRWWQSPIQAYYIPGAQTQTVLIDHLKKLHAAGMYGAIIDDAHNLTAPDMEHLIDLIQLHCPGAPVMASFGADFDDIKEGYPNERYFDMRQWFLRTQEKESVYFQKWETAHDAQLYAAHVYRDKKGFQHTPDRIRSMFATALPFVDGIAWYSLLNKETNIMNDHKKMKAQNPKAVTVWDIIVDCTNDYLKAYAAKHVKA